MQLKYTIDISAEEPIMMLDSHIGFDSDKGEGIDGAEFAKELLYLDSLQKKRIQVRINSIGGSVIDGMSIYNAILKANAKVDTYNIGIAASIAGVIFQAGRNRIMADYALLMVHNPSNGDKKSLAKIKESLLVMLSRKTGKNEKELSKLMDVTSWFSASESIAAGLADKIEISKDNKPKIVSSDVKAAWLEATEIINSYKPKTINKMENIINKLGLAADATEETILAAISEMENKMSEFEKVKKAHDEAKAKCNELADKLKELKKAKDESDEEAENAKKMEAKNKAEELVNDALKAGKFSNEFAGHWTNLALENFDAASEMIKGLSVTKKGVDIVVNRINESDDLLGNVVARTMADLQNKFNK
jgi:ATP-dependent protease ClpP protease subunit